MAFNPNDELTIDALTQTLASHESNINNNSQILNDTNNLRLQGNANNLANLKVYAQRLSFPIGQTLNRILFPFAFNSIPTVSLTVEQADPFFVTAVVKSVSTNDLEYAIFYSGNINVQNYTLHVTAIGY